ncbi:NAD(P)/FAD-dependent oxidoreductase [Brevibacillus humidisoli]|uniref:phytoene desaturase family protein n=1 Tax=Brevibacillus humidisoli TaxID=2895522 RepID=UPI001E36FAE3|nr:NAD(P)/FAD-dependent oxidoreductase [Brevibacillus humidisoli]UFJ42571.1 NAD(P)/FAD-dependent oxidoreductase [Brevibacillus humidisoli]
MEKQSGVVGKERTVRGEAVLENKYDAIVIGAGIGGLFAANFLVKAGVKTLLIERHNVVGGYLQGGWHKGFYFDYGTQSNEIKGAILPALQVLELDDRVTFHQCHHRFMSSEGLDLSYHTLDDAERAFVEAYPESEAGLRNYFQYYRRVTEVAKLVNEEGLGSIITTNSTSFMPDYHAYWKTKPYYEEMMDYDSIHSWRKAREFLGGNSRVARVLTHFGYRNQSALSTGIFWHLWRDDYYYNEGGKQEFVDMLADAFVERGGTLAMETHVEEILVDDDAAVGVRLANGKVIRAEHVLSNADMRMTMERLLGGHEAVRGWIDQMRKTTLSEAFYTVYLGLDMSPEELNEYLKGAHHSWIFPTHKPLAEPFDVSFHGSLPMEISAPCLHDPSLAPGGKSNVVLQTFSFYDWMNRWEINADGRRASKYRALKKQVEQQLVDNLELVIPGVRSKIVHQFSSTPLTHERYTLNANGATGAWTWNPKRTFVKLTEQRVTTPIRNLYCAGHWALYPGGLLTATIAGKIAADLVIHGYTPTHEQSEADRLTV